MSNRVKLYIFVRIIFSSHNLITSLFSRDNCSAVLVTWPKGAHHFRVSKGQNLNKLHENGDDKLPKKIRKYDEITLRFNVIQSIPSIQLIPIGSNSLFLNKLYLKIHRYRFSFFCHPGPDRPKMTSSQIPQANAYMRFNVSAIKSLSLQGSMWMTKCMKGEFPMYLLRKCHLISLSLVLFQVQVTEYASRSGISKSMSLRKSQFLNLPPPFTLCHFATLSQNKFQSKMNRSLCLFIHTSLLFTPITDLRCMYIYHYFVRRHMSSILIQVHTLSLSE